MKHFIRYLGFCLFFICLMVFLNSCKKFVQVDPPKTELVTSTVFADDATANAAQTVIYSQMTTRDLWPYYLALLTGYSSDEFNNYSTTQGVIQFYTNELIPSNTFILNRFWSPAYNYISQSNAIIEALQTNNAISPKVKQQLIGESKFIRSYFNFYLTNLFGDIPLVTSTDYKSNSNIYRTPSAEVYQQIVSDLKDAQSLLDENYLDADAITVTTERVRPNKWVATALLARVYLFSGDYVNAEAQATALIDHTSLFNLESDLNQVFLKNSREAIWQLMTPQPANSSNTPEGSNFILTTIPGASSVNCATISQHLLKSFEPSDNRKTNWLGVYVSGTDSFYFPFKYKVVNSSDVTEYSTVFRLAEQYLIRSEARLYQGNIAGALEDLNAIRSRAGLANSTSDDQPTISAAILHERQIDFFAESGFRWLDLKRTGSVDSVMNVVVPLKGNTWNTRAQLYPIPQTEIRNDANLSQNAGY